MNMYLNVLRICSIFASLVLAGCSGTPVRSSATATEIGQKAVVILSVSHDQEAGGATKAIFYLDESRYPGRVVMTSTQDTLSIPTASDYQSRRGHLYVLELDPGRHQIDGWQVSSVSGGRIFPREPAAPLTFEVGKGEVLYLGNLHASVTMGRGMLFGPQVANGAVPLVMDRSVQDIPLAEAKTPSLKGRVRVALLPLGPWIKSNETIKRFDPIPIPVLPKK